MSACVGCVCGAAFLEMGRACTPVRARACVCARGCTQVCIFHLGSGRQVAQLAGHHKVNVRDMHYDVPRSLLATCSFDKTVKLFHGGA